MAGVQEPGDGYVSAVSQPRLPSSAFRTGMSLKHQTLLLFVPLYNAFGIQNVGFMYVNEGNIILSPPLKNFWCADTEVTLSGKEGSLYLMVCIEYCLSSCWCLPQRSILDSSLLLGCV